MPDAALYCPGLDDEMQKNIDSLVYAKWIPKMAVHVGGGRSLERVDVKGKLYVLCHGHSQLPLFSTDAGKWTADQLATLMVNDGFKHAHREIDMLVCHAGESITTKSAAKQRMAVYHQFKNAKAKDNMGLMGKLSKKFDKVAKKGPSPSLFNHEQQVIPMCAQFVQALKTKGFNYIRATAYKAPVCQYYSDGPGKVRLDTSSKGGSWGAKATPELTVTWL